MNATLQLALTALFKIVSTERVLKIVGDYLKNKILPLAPEALMDFIADLATYVFAKAPDAVSAQAAESLKACAAKAK